MFDKLFEIVAKSTRFGFALAFAGTIFILGNKYEWWSIKLAPDQTSYIIFATLLGYGILVASALANGFRLAWAVADLGWTAFRYWRQNNNIMDKLHELTPRQTAALWWISQNPNVIIHGSIFEDPFRALCSKKYLHAASGTAQAQGFKVNKVVFRKSAKIAERLPPHLLDQIAKGPAPWR
jgi:hypothetical protein